jgi:FlaA1/EpsC-like NDP-sugar epimerase
VTYIGIHRLGYEEARLFRAGSVLRWYEGLSFDRRFFLGFIDVVLIAAAYWGAFVLKYNLAWSSAQKQWYLTTFPLVILIQLATFFGFNLYRGVWRAIGVGDLINIGMAVATGVFLSYILAVINAPPTDGTVTYFVIYLMLLGSLIIISRSAFRILSYIRQREQSNYGNALIYGAGHHGQLVLRELSNNSMLQLHAVGFIDDDPTLIGRRVDRLPVIGSGHDLASLLSKRQVTTLIVAASNVEEGRLSRVITVCHEHRIAVLRCNLNIEPVETNGRSIAASRAI